MRRILRPAGHARWSFGPTVSARFGLLQRRLQCRRTISGYAPPIDVADFHASWRTGKARGHRRVPESPEYPARAVGRGHRYAGESVWSASAPALPGGSTRTPSTHSSRCRRSARRRTAKAAALCARAAVRGAGLRVCACRDACAVVAHRRGAAEACAGARRSGMRRAGRAAAHLSRRHAAGSVRAVRRADALARMRWRGCVGAHMCL